ncbi:MAG: ATP-dependent zinc metalloprotease FtsH, partial [Spirochaetales bacterium]
IEKVIAGLEKKTKVINIKEKKVIAFHETGHAVTAAFTPGSDPVKKVSIIPRGYGALGYTLQMPLEDRYVVSEEELLSQIDVLLGGRAAEQIIFGSISTGAANDITRATDIARRMITDFGMSERFRHVALTKKGQGFSGASAPEPFLVREYSEDTQKYVDDEIARIIAARYDSVVALLSSKREMINKIAGVLLEKEVIEEADFFALTTGEAGQTPPAEKETVLA